MIYPPPDLPVKTAGLGWQDVRKQNRFGQLTKRTGARGRKVMAFTTFD